MLLASQWHTAICLVKYYYRTWVDLLEDCSSSTSHISNTGNLLEKQILQPLHHIKSEPPEVGPYNLLWTSSSRDSAISMNHMTGRNEKSWPWRWELAQEKAIYSSKTIFLSLHITKGRKKMLKEFFSNRPIPYSFFSDRYKCIYI